MLNYQYNLFVKITQVQLNHSLLRHVLAINDVRYFSNVSPWITIFVLLISALVEVLSFMVPKKNDKGN